MLLALALLKELWSGPESFELGDWYPPSASLPGRGGDCGRCAGDITTGTWSACDGDRVSESRAGLFEGAESDGLTCSIVKDERPCSLVLGAAGGGRFSTLNGGMYLLVRWCPGKGNIVQRR